MFIIYGSIISTLSNLGINKAIISNKIINFENNDSIKCFLLVAHGILSLFLGFLVSLFFNK